jgi:hypothetical protein
VVLKPRLRRTSPRLGSRAPPQIGGISHLNFKINAFNKRKPIRRRLKSYGGTGEKAQSRQRRDEQVHFEEDCNAAIGP